MRFLNRRHFFKGADFKRLVDPYIRKALRKGVPPVFVDLRPLLRRDPAKLAAVEELCAMYMENLQKSDTFDGAPGAEKEPATALLWLLFFNAQVLDFKRDYQGALETVDRAIEHTPTLIELFVLKGKIYRVRKWSF